jgi:hypothetical protein
MYAMQLSNPDHVCAPESYLFTRVQTFIILIVLIVLVIIIRALRAGGGAYHLLHHLLRDLLSLPQESSLRADTANPSAAQYSAGGYSKYSGILRAAP